MQVLLSVGQSQNAARGRGSPCCEARTRRPPALCAQPLNHPPAHPPTCSAVPSTSRFSLPPSLRERLMMARSTVGMPCGKEQHGQGRHAGLCCARGRQRSTPALCTHVRTQHPPASHARTHATLARTPSSRACTMTPGSARSSACIRYASLPLDSSPGGRTSSVQLDAMLQARVHVCVRVVGGREGVRVRKQSWCREPACSGPLHACWLVCTAQAPRPCTSAHQTRQSP